ncbi:hypothetical protein EVAR_102205_1 [Eumeta japonica]|uniref:Uncharacterized protein n=1 Tax=Eumeta variegata TaxID=151549 RepID=A0A4C1WFI3_EUMVA|nr:hypothetical protein EVAR_102205_1 [Eumeta japonica]
MGKAMATPANRMSSNKKIRTNKTAIGSSARAALRNALSDLAEQIYPSINKDTPPFAQTNQSLFNSMELDILRRKRISRDEFIDEMVPQNFNQDPIMEQKKRKRNSSTNELKTNSYAKLWCTY